jgi:hypothetical protein
MKATEEIGLRVLAAVLMRVSGQSYRPRFERLKRLYDLIRGGQLRGGRTLHGCRIAPATRVNQLFGAGTLSILREHKRRAGAQTPKKTARNRPEINAPA